MHVDVKPALIRWAVERSGKRAAYLQSKFNHLDEWQEGITQPTLKQLESFAKAAYVPVGYLFLPEPPEEKLPIPDMRTIQGMVIPRPSPDLLEVLFACQQRQAWYQEYAEGIGEEAKRFVGSAKLVDSPERVAAAMRETIGLSVADHRALPNWESAFRRLIEQAESVGILVMVSGVVGSNNKRILDPKEFRGFALTDPIAPLLFINGADTKAAQMFTFAHELAHIWLGQSALSDVAPAKWNLNRIEVWCNQVAAEFLVPSQEFHRELRCEPPLGSLMRLAREFKVSTLVILRRLLDSGLIDRESYQATYASEMQRLVAKATSGGGNFYVTQGVRLSRRFARAIISSALEGHTLFRDAFQMLGIKKEKTFMELGRTLEVMT